MMNFEALQSICDNTDDIYLFKIAYIFIFYVKNCCIFFM